jgi:hypothetical protein
MVLTEEDMRAIVHKSNVESTQKIGTLISQLKHSLQSRLQKLTDTNQDPKKSFDYFGLVSVILLVVIVVVLSIGMRGLYLSLKNLQLKSIDLNVLHPELVQ